MIAFAVMCVIFMTGCGERGAERRIGKEARYYIANKYGFRPRTTEVELKHVGELEGVWHKKGGGTASCEYNGRTFKVYVSTYGLNAENAKELDVTDFREDDRGTVPLSCFYVNPGRYAPPVISSYQPIVHLLVFIG